MFDAALSNSLEAAIVLLDRGAQIDARDIVGNTPLMFAITQASRPIVVLLVKKTFTNVILVL